MRMMLRSVVLAFSLCLMLAGCGRKPSEESSRSERAKPQATQTEAKTAVQGAPPAAEKATESQAVAVQQPKGRLSGVQLQHAPTPAEEKSQAAALPSETERAVPDNATVSAPQPQAASATPLPPEKTASAEPKKVPTQDVFMLRDSPLGVVRFEHKLHQERAADKCETCHHASRPEKPAKAAQQSCFGCHTKPPQPGMKTGRQGAFHSLTAQSGTCIDCHKMQNAQGKKAPTKCMECHKKENT
jgi:predicted small lipoprotein YifL